MNRDDSSGGSGRGALATTAPILGLGFARALTLGRAALVIGLAVHLLFLVSLRTHRIDRLFVETRDQGGQASDFFGIYQAGDNLIQGRSIYAQEGRPPESSRHVPFFYYYRYLPPTAYLAAVATLVLRPWPAYWIWVLATEAMLGLLLFSLTRLRAPPVPVRLAMAGMALGFFPFYLEQWMGQFSFLMALFLWGTFWPYVRGSGGDGTVPEEPPRALLRRRDLWSWSAAVALKNYPALFALPLLRLGQWRRVALTAGLVVAVCLPYYLLRPQDVSRFASLNLRPMSGMIMHGCYSLSNLVRALTWHLPEAWTGRLLVLGPFDVYGGNVPMLVVQAGVVLLSLLVTWRMNRRAAPEAMVLWALTFFLIYKDIWEYHYVMCLPLIWLLGVRGDWRAPLIFGVLLGAPTPFIFYRDLYAAHSADQWPAGILVLHYGSKAFPVLGLYFVAARRTLGPAGWTRLLHPRFWWHHDARTGRRLPSEMRS